MIFLCPNASVISPSKYSINSTSKPFPSPIWILWGVFCRLYMSRVDLHMWCEAPVSHIQTSFFFMLVFSKFWHLAIREKNSVESLDFSWWVYFVLISVFLFFPILFFYKVLPFWKSLKSPLFVIFCKFSPNSIGQLFQFTSQLRSNILFINRVLVPCHIRKVSELKFVFHFVLFTKPKFMFFKFLLLTPSYFHNKAWSWRLSHILLSHSCCLRFSHFCPSVLWNNSIHHAQLFFNICKFCTILGIDLYIFSSFQNIASVFPVCLQKVHMIFLRPSAWHLVPHLLIWCFSPHDYFSSQTHFLSMSFLSWLESLHPMIFWMQFILHIIQVYHAKFPLQLKDLIIIFFWYRI